MTAPLPDLPAPTFPPLLRGQPVPAGVDPFVKAAAEAMAGADPGLVVWSQDATTARCAIVLAPEQPLRMAMGAVHAVELGLADCLGALAPPEVAVHFSWPDRLKVNGALCGRVRAAASSAEEEAVPEWLVIGFEVPLMPVHEAEPGETPDQTTLYDEGCVELATPQIIESWSRHMLAWLNRFLNDGPEPLHSAWRARCDTLGEHVEHPQRGVFMGLDEHGNMLLRDAAGTRAVPLSSMLEMTG